MARQVATKKSITKSVQDNKKAKKSKPRSAPPNEFQKIFLSNLLPEDLANLSSNEKQRLTASIWSLTEHRKRGDVNLRIFNPTTETDGWTVDHTVLEVVGDDMPFLVDSVNGELQRRGLTIHLFIHPVMNIVRNNKGAIEKFVDAPAPQAGMSESIMHVQFDQCSDPATLADIASTLEKIFGELKRAVEDWPKMRQRMSEAAAEVMVTDGFEIAAEEREEARAFLNWLAENNFVYLGYRRLDLTKNGQATRWKVESHSGLGILHDPELRLFGGLRDLDQQPKEVQKFLQQQRLIIVTKTNEKARIHRTVPMDAIFVQRFDKNGKIIGEHLFVGLFTSRSYSQTPTDVPFVRHKIKQVISRAHFDPLGHNGKALVNILEHYPRDELFQIDAEDLFHHSVGIVKLQERTRISIFLRRDPFQRFVTCLIYVPREHYDTHLRQKLQQKLSQVFGGAVTDYDVRVDDNPLARVFLTVGITPQTVFPDLATLQNDIRELSRNWRDRLREALASAHGEAKALELLHKYGSAFPPAYCEAMSPAEAMNDIRAIEKTGSYDKPIVELVTNSPDGLYYLKLYQPGAPLVLSDVLPLIENTGLKVEYMNGPHYISPEGGMVRYYIHEFACKLAQKTAGDAALCKSLFEEAFELIWKGDVENDALNGLMLSACLPWREIVMFRTLLRYLRQLRVPYSFEMMAATLLAHSEITRQLAALFVARFTPDFKGNRDKAIDRLTTDITDAMAEVSHVEEDRVLRRVLNLLQAALRTNYFQTTAAGTAKEYLSIKFNSKAIEYMPLPKPMAEVFVYSPRVEAVHLRGGKVARGGIRWSDRREDFRSEVLGLVKAQMVKNCVIVPVGSKGGFVVKRPPAEADKFATEGIECYKTMMRGLLDITDNRINGKIVPPQNVVRHDGDDPYLVVAADKGTAKFSDIANGISQEYGFWLDDAFASGGSVGYDHKQMGITARGAWEAVKRHFREIGVDIQTTDFTVVGVGDMSGDVFGNGMLLSKHIRMVAAFDHRHIFIDPTPDAKISFGERERLFKLPRSSWADYDAKKISKGGGVFARNVKSIKLTPEIRKLLGLTVENIAPSDLIQTILKSQVDLLYFGGIGTYIKASDESQEDAGDRTNEALRINGNEVQALVVGEGANLGVTQRGRIEYALKGGRINTDAIDNSAGVDTSDHEVNIKILFSKPLQTKKLNLAQRNKLLASMTDDVAHLVLRDNYLQTQALSLAEKQAVELLPVHARSIRILEKSGLLNRRIEFLPDETEIAERQLHRKGLTRPELSVLLAYSKIWLYDQLLESNLPDDAFMLKDLRSYFPKALQDKFDDAITSHQLRREIIATVLTNTLVNRVGAHFPFIVAERTGRSAEDVARAYLLVRSSFNMHYLREEIEKLDNKVPSATQTAMLLALNQVTNYVAPWFLTQDTLPKSLIPAIEYYKDKVTRLAAWLEKGPDEIVAQNKAREDAYVKQGVPQALARQLSVMPYLATAPDIAQLAENAKCSIETAAATFFGLGGLLGLDWLRKKSDNIAAETPYQRDAISHYLDELTTAQRTLAVQALSTGKKSTPKQKQSGEDLLQAWTTQNATALESYDAMLTEFKSVAVFDVSMLSLAVRQLNALDK